MSEAICGVCQEAIEGEVLACKGCEALYHRKCRLGQGHCLTDGCKRSKPLEVGKDVERNRSPLAADATPLIFGFCMALIFGLPAAYFMRLPPLGSLLLVFVLTIAIGALKVRLS
tara:strand:- start:74 stop:415 length:342 start_codon:yes stop_codon:yes gene_type:complete